MTEVKFVIGTDVSMEFCDIRTDRPLFVTPCTFEPNVSGAFQLAAFCDVAFELTAAPRAE